MRDCFLDGPVEIHYDGPVGVVSHRDGLYQVFKDVACQTHIVEMHHGGPPNIEVHGPDSASARWGLVYHLMNTEVQTLSVVGGLLRRRIQARRRAMVDQQSALQCLLRRDLRLEGRRRFACSTPALPSRHDLSRPVTSRGLICQGAGPMDTREGLRADRPRTLASTMTAFESSGAPDGR